MKEYNVTITENAIHNLMDSYVDHKKMTTEYEIEGDTENPEYTFHKGCCETAESYMRILGVCPTCDYITDKLNNK